MLRNTHFTCRRRDVTPGMAIYHCRLESLPKEFADSVQGRLRGFNETFVWNGENPRISYPRRHNLLVYHLPIVNPVNRFMETICHKDTLPQRAWLNPSLRERGLERRGNDCPRIPLRDQDAGFREPLKKY
jgi:hypothetical protein